MTSRERVFAALDFRPVDVVPLRIFPAMGGFYDHGRKLIDLIRSTGHDFGDFPGLALPEPPRPEDVDASGRYHAFRTDAWGTTWEYLIPGIWGHPVKWPLDDWSALEAYRCPPSPPASGAEFEALRAAWAKSREKYFHMEWGGSIFEKLHSIRRFEDVLVDIELDAPEINRLADRIVENVEGWVARALALGADAVQFGDDFGTTTGPIVSPASWRRFFKPRYKRLFAPIRAARKRIFFHICGRVEWLLDDFAEIGVDVIWPQVTLCDARELAKMCRDRRIAVEIQPDRGDLMQRGSPGEIRETVRRLVEEFNTLRGGSWPYIEIDPNFPWANVEALFGVARELRGPTAAARP
jgi:hypothetical protein